jgi:hypothetical protein
MPTLIVSNDFAVELPGLGRKTPFLGLSEKRVTKAVREGLRHHFGLAAVKVSCDATIAKNEWHGRCQMSGKAWNYRVIPTASQ